MQLHFFLILLSLSLPSSLAGNSNAHRILAHAAAAAATAPAPATPLPTPSAPAPKADIISIMSRKGCKAFADLLTASDNAQAFRDSVDGGLTVFCPTDDAVKSFLPKYKNLTADAKASLLLFHGIPVYNSLAMLKSSNGVVNTLATDGTAKNYNFTVQNNGEMVTLESAGPKADVKSTLFDKDPLAVYSIDEVLEPLELFKPAEVPAPAPAPDTVADAPAAGGKKKSKKGKHAAASPADGPDASPADQKVADESAGGRVLLQWWVAAGAAAAAAALMVVA